MKPISMVVLSLLLTPPLFADAGQRLIPAGALVSCTTGDGRISSKTTAVGDPMLCKVEHRRGDFMLPYGSYLGGEFAEYKDPGHFVGKGWMMLSFDRLYVGDTVVPIDAKVVDVPGYKIDAQGRILGKGHAVRDTITWMIPVLWPIDLINLPRRGPRPTLKSETALTLRVMEDIEVPVTPEPERDPYGLIPRGDSGYAPEPPPPEDNQPAPEMSYAPDEPQQPMPAPEPPPPVAYAAPVPYPPMYAPMYVAPPMVAYGRFSAGPRGPAMAYGPRVYAPRPYAGYGVRGYASPGPYAAVRPYAATRPYTAARPYGYGYGYAGRGYAASGVAGRSFAMNARGGAGIGGGYRGR